MQMSLKKITIRNFKLIESTSLEPGKINQIVGENNQGKTTILEAIQFAMVGSTDESLIRHGEEIASVTLEFTDGLVVVRWLTKGAGQGLTVQLNDMSPQRPQSYLNGLVGVGAFNPKEVLDPKKRTEYLMKVIDLKVTKKQIKEIVGDKIIPDFNYDDHGLKVIERASKFFYDTRAVENKRLKAAKSEIVVYQKNLGDPPPESRIKESDQEIRVALDLYQKDLKGLKQKYDDWAKEKKEYDEHYSALKRSFDVNNLAIQEMRKLETELENTRMSLVQELEIHQKDKENFGPEPDIGNESAMINEHIADVNAEILLRKNRESYQKEIDFIGVLKSKAETIEGEAKRYGEIYKCISNSLTAKLMSAADLPVKGMTFEDGKFKLDGVDVEQLSSSKTLSLALAITKKLNKKANLICIDGVELLDERTFLDLHAEMIKDEFNYFLTKVGPAFKNDEDKVFKMNNGGVH